MEGHYKLRKQCIGYDIPETGLWNPQRRSVGFWNQRRPAHASSPLFFSLFIIYLYLEAINVILKWWPRRDPCFVKQGIFVFSLVILSAREFLQLRGADKWPISVTSAYCTQCKTYMEFLFASFSINISELKKLNVSKYS